MVTKMKNKIDRLEAIQFHFENDYIEDFLSLPKKIYSGAKLLQNYSEEKALLLENHFLSKYFSLDKILVYLNEEVVARCIITYYPEDHKAYLGFFESIHKEASSKLFEYAENLAKSKEKSTIIGPVNSSFWINYRLKNNYFEKKPYFSEPYNISYTKMWERAGFNVCGRWISNKYDVFDKEYNKEKYLNRLERFQSKGYEIKSPQSSNFNQSMEEIYYLIIELYKDFDVFKQISLDDFKKQYKNFEKIIDYSIIKITYYKNEPVGFFIGVPNYGNLLSKKMTLFTILNILWIRKFSKSYVMLYMGVKKEHSGLGTALVQTILNEVKLRKISCYGSLIKEGKVTGNYYNDNINETFEYLLFEKNLGYVPVSSGVRGDSPAPLTKPKGQ